jgi:NAD(P)-dependent dehydrogenase (short-subunit alcohol dehydrogenase family)
MPGAWRNLLQSFEGRVALITGAAQGMGATIAQAFRDQGAKLVLLDRNQAALQHTAEVIGGQGSANCVRAVTGDVSSREDVRRAVSAAVETWGSLDVVIAQAGIGGVVPLGDIDDEAWQRMLDVNLTGVFLTVQESARQMKAGGSIVVTSSTNAFFVEAETAHYSASKGGVRTFVRAAAMELGRAGIRINVVHPGIIRTPLTTWTDKYPEVARDYLKRVPLGRFGEPEEIAQSILFLASDAASYMTGADMVIDGGVSLGVYRDFSSAEASETGANRDV